MCELVPCVIPSTVLPHVTEEELRLRVWPLGRDKEHRVGSGDRGPKFESLLYCFPAVWP